VSANTSGNVAILLPRTTSARGNSLRPAAVERAELHQGDVVHELPDIWILRVADEHGSGVGAFFRPDRLVVPHQRLASLVMTMSNSSVLTEFE